MCAPSIVCCRSCSGPCSGNFSSALALSLNAAPEPVPGWRGERGGAAVSPAIDCWALPLTYPAGLRNKSRTTDCLFYGEFKYRHICNRLQEKRILFYIA